MIADPPVFVGVALHRRCRSDVSLLHLRCICCGSCHVILRPESFEHRNEQRVACWRTSANTAAPARRVMAWCASAVFKGGVIGNCLIKIDVTRIVNMSKKTVVLSKKLGSLAKKLPKWSLYVMVRTIYVPLVRTVYHGSNGTMVLVRGNLARYPIPLAPSTAYSESLFIRIDL